MGNIRDTLGNVITNLGVLIQGGPIIDEKGEVRKRYIPPHEELIENYFENINTRFRRYSSRG